MSPNLIPAEAPPPTLFVQDTLPRHRPEQWRYLTEQVNQWTQANRTLVKKVEVREGSEEGRLVMSVTSKAVEYDPELDRLLNEFDVRIARDEKVNLFQMDAYVCPDLPDFDAIEE